MSASEHHVRTIFVSDIHLGTRACQADLVLDFLRVMEADTIYLVGDIIDGWRLKSGWLWPQSHNDVVQKFLRKVRKGTKVIYIPGNHDEFLRDYIGMNFGGITVEMEAVHETADGKKYLILHGDKYDVVVQHIRWLAYLGDWAYDAAVAVNAAIGFVRRRLGLPYWSFSGWSKRQVKSAVSFIGAFEEAVASDAQRSGVDGVICGHIHHPCMREIDGIHYINTGDWVDSCSALIEHHDGRMELIHWPDYSRSMVQLPAFEIEPAQVAA